MTTFNLKWVETFVGKQYVFVKHECLQNGHFLRNVTLIFHLNLDDMTLTSWVLSKVTCIPNMSIVP